MPMNSNPSVKNLNRAVAETTFFAFLLWYLDPAQRDVSNVGYVARMMLIAFLTLVFRGFYNEMAKEELKQPAETKQTLPNVTPDSPTAMRSDCVPKSPMANVSSTQTPRFTSPVTRQRTFHNVDSNESNTDDLEYLGSPKSPRPGA